jgi:hypothetical protein
LVPLAIVGWLWHGVPLASGQQTLKHPGRVVEIGANKPLSVDVRAWPESKQTGKEGDCPLYGKAPLYSTQSTSNDGRFVLNVSGTNPTYTTTYCASEYFPRADRDVPNKGDGSPVMPFPVEMYPRKLDQKSYEQAVRSKTTALLNDLVYLQSINPEGFDSVVKTLASDIGRGAPQREKLITNVRDLILDWKR